MIKTHNITMEVCFMMIRVMYSDGRFDLVKKPMLDQLLEQNRLASFKRSDGWAVVGRDPIRSSGNSAYPGPERRIPDA
jgi:hypothetical protein